MKIALPRFEPMSWQPPAQQASSQDHWTILPLNKSLFLAKWVNNLAKIHITRESLSKVHIETQLRVIYIFNMNLDFQLVVTVIDCTWFQVALRFLSNKSPTGCTIMFYSWKADIVIHFLWKKILLLVNRHRFSSCKCRELETVQHCQQETLRLFCETLNITKCQPYVLQMWWNKLKYSFYYQNPAYLPQIYYRFFDKHGFTSFKQHLPEKFHWGKMLR